MDRDFVIDREVAGAGSGVAFHQLEGVEHRAVGVVVAAELERLQQIDQPAAVVVRVRRLQRRPHRAVVLGALRPVLVHQPLQCLLPTRDRRIHHGTDGVVGVIDRGFGDREQDVLLAAHLLERVRQLLGHLPTSACTDAMHRLDQQINQHVDEFALAHHQHRRQQRPAQLIRMRPQMRR